MQAIQITCLFTRLLDRSFRVDDDQKFGSRKGPIFKSVLLVLPDSKKN